MHVSVNHSFIFPQYEIIDRKYAFTIASTGFGAKHFYEFMTVQFANRVEPVLIRENTMMMLHLNGFFWPVLARVVYICHYEKKERPSVTFEVYFALDDATNKNIYGRKSKPTTTSSGLRGYRFVNISPVRKCLWMSCHIIVLISHSKKLFPREKTI